jgi:RNA polymerase sigma factor for flagellar operon FliA
MTPEQLFLDHLSYIEKVATQTCRRCHLRKEEEEDFLGEVRLKIMADDYAALRKFQGKSTLKSYLAAVIKNQIRDFQNRLWGKWRHSELAKRLGDVATLLEKLLRDGYTFDEAVQILRTNHKIEISWQELNEIAAKLPPRTPRHWEAEEVLKFLPSIGDRPDTGIIEREKRALRVRALEALQKALKSVPAEDQVIIKMQQWNRFTVAQISRVLNLDQKPLYKRIQKTLKHLKSEMERQGIRKEDIDDLLDDE